MIEVIIAMGLMALLFVLFGAIKYRGCTGHCAGCTRACRRYTDGDNDVR